MGLSGDFWQVIIIGMNSIIRSLKDLKSNVVAKWLAQWNLLNFAWKWRSGIKYFVWYILGHSNFMFNNLLLKTYKHQLMVSNPPIKPPYLMIFLTNILVLTTFSHFNEKINNNFHDGSLVILIAYFFSTSIYKSWQNFLATDNNNTFSFILNE